MQQHAMALGYFFLSVFCIFTSSQGYLTLWRIPLLAAALVAAAMGIGFLLSAWSAQFYAAWSGWLHMVRLAQQIPEHGNAPPADGLSTN